MKMPVPKKSEAELNAMSLEELRQLAMQEVEELEAEAAKQAAGNAEQLAEAHETPEETAAREAAEQEAAEAEKAEAEKAAAEKADAEKVDQERDAQGRFAKKTTPVVEEEDEGEPDEYVYRREIDLGDGAGIQVFEGRGPTELEAMVDLNNRLVVAQENATRTIREFQRKHPKQPETPQEQKISEDLEYTFAEQFKTKPSEAFKAMFKELTGMDIAEFKTAQAAQKAALEAAQAQEKSLGIQRDFVAAHPEYIQTKENGDLITEWVQEHNYNEFTPVNLEKAFEDLSERGLLKLKTDEASAPTKVKVEPVVPVPARIEQPVTKTTEVTPVRSPKKASSISSRSAAPVVKPELTEDDLYKMPMDKLKELASQQLAEQNRAQ
jgi:hypothetical protein